AARADGDGPCTPTSGSRAWGCTGSQGESSTPERDSDAVNTVGEPCAGKPHARFDEGPLARAPSPNQRPTLLPHGGGAVAYLNATAAEGLEAWGARSGWLHSSTLVRLLRSRERAEAYLGTRVREFAQPWPGGRPRSGVRLGKIEDGRRRADRLSPTQSWRRNMATLAPPRPKSYDDSFWKPITLWLTTTDHKLIGIMYMTTGVLAFVIGGVFALVIRLQVSVPNAQVVDADVYNQLLSAHGTTMIFFFVTIFMTGIANYFVPIMIGARDMAFPRVNLLGFWMIPVSIVIYYMGFFTPEGALNAGWTGYTPLTTQPFNNGLGVDFWPLTSTLWAIRAIRASPNFLTTLVALRAPGMRLPRLPLFVWAQISPPILLLIVGAPPAAAMILLEFDRQFGTNFFTTQGR